MGYVLAQSEQVAGEVKNHWLQVMDRIFDGLIPFSNAQVKGRPEYLTCGRLADYEYIHQCYKYNFDVKLALIHR